MQFLFFTLMTGVQAQEASVPPSAGPTAAAVEHFEFRYGLAHPALPSFAELDKVKVRLVRTDGVWHSPGNAAGETLALGHVPEGSSFDPGALREVAQALVRWFNARGLYGVWVTFSELESSGSGLVDTRSAGDRTARLVIWASQVAEVRTLARGGRFKPQDSINNPKHRLIIAGSPLHPGVTAEQPGSLFQQDVLEDYVHNLSLHPGRRVEASIASAGTPGKIVLDYLVNEPKPWQLFSQISNTGTPETGEWRGRLGFQDNQLTNHDDILNVDAITTPSFNTYGTFVSYRIPILRPVKLLARVYGSYGDFLANDTTLQNLRFVGKNWLGGFEFTNRLTLPRGWALVSALGAVFTHYEIESQISKVSLVKGYSNFLVPYLSSTISRDGDGWSLSGSLRFDSTVGNIANTDTTNGVPALGRIGADSEWTSLRWNLNGSMFLDRLFNSVEHAPYLTHEVTGRVWGKFLLRGQRLIPQEEQPMGGAFTVRGYPESILSADQFAIGSFEYAYHLAHALKPGEPGILFGRPFKWRPTPAKLAPDWDMIFRAFFDYGYRSVTRPAPVAGQSSSQTASSELPLLDRSLTMAGAGGGVEFIVRQNMSIRCDVGMALNELRDGSRPVGEQIVVPVGNVQTYLVASFTW